MSNNVYKRGNIYWIDVSYNGERVRESSGLKSKLKAEKVAEKIYQELVAKMRGEKLDLTLGEALTDFLRYSQTFKTSYKHDQSRAKMILRFFKPNIFLKEIKKRMVEEFVEWLREKIIPRKGNIVSDEAIKKYLNLLSVIINTAIENEEFTGKNPVHKVISKLENSGENENVFSVEEMRQIFFQAKLIKEQAETQNDKDFYIYLTLLAIGVRPIETFEIMLTQIRNDVLTIPKRSRSKTRKNRTIYLSPAAFEILSSHESESMFLINVGERKSSAFKNQWARVKKATGLVGRMYDLRHSFATIAYEQESDLLLVQTLLDHSNISTTSRYVKSTKTRADKTAHNVQDKLFGEIIPLKKTGEGGK